MRHARARMRGLEPGAARSTKPSTWAPTRPSSARYASELEQFATSQLRLHLAIAERDRYLLTSIELECDGNDHERELLRRFVREFRPEQIKRYLAKEVIARLRNASAIDLSQFAGLNAEVDRMANRSARRSATAI